MKSIKLLFSSPRNANNRYTRERAFARVWVGKYGKNFGRRYCAHGLTQSFGSVSRANAVAKSTLRGALSRRIEPIEAKRRVVECAGPASGAFLARPRLYRADRASGIALGATSERLIKLKVSKLGSGERIYDSGERKKGAGVEARRKFAGERASFERRFPECRPTLGSLDARTARARSRCKISRRRRNIVIRPRPNLPTSLDSASLPMYVDQRKESVGGRRRERVNICRR